MTADLIGWAATAVFVSSYAFRSAEVLRRVQMLGATMWVAYGMVMGAPPVIVANVLVLGAALWASRRGRSRQETGPEGTEWSGTSPLGLQASVMRLRRKATEAPSRLF
jgi:hypothetical protein